MAPAIPGRSCRSFTYWCPVVSGGFVHTDLLPLQPVTLRNRGAKSRNTLSGIGRGRAIILSTGHVEPKKTIAETVGCLDPIETPFQFIRGHMGDNGDVGTEGGPGIDGQGAQVAVVESLSDDVREYVAVPAYVGENPAELFLQDK